MESPSLPSDQTQWLSAVRRQLRYYFRTWRFVGLLGFVLLVTVAGTALSIAYGSSGKSAADYLYGIFSNFGTFGIIIGAFIGGDAIAVDFGTGSGYFMLVLPVRRVVLLLGRFTAAFLVSFALILVYYAVGLSGAVWFYGFAGIPWLDFVASLALAALFALATLATAFLFSSFFRSPAVSMVVTILVLFLAFLFIDGILSITSLEPWFSLPYAGQAIGLVFQGQPHLTIISTPGARGLQIHTWYPYVWEGAVIMLVYFVVGLVLSAIIYQYRELKG